MIIKVHTWCKDLSISAVFEWVDCVAVTLQFTDHESVADVPQQNSAVGWAGRQVPTAGRERKRVDRSLQGEKNLSLRKIQKVTAVNTTDSFSDKPNTPFMSLNGRGGIR